MTEMEGPADLQAPADPQAASGAGGDSEASAGSFEDARIDDAVAHLDRLERLPIADHVEVFEDIHSRFRDALADVADDQEPSGSG